LDNPDVLKKLQVELKEALPNKYDPVELKVVEQLPYLVSSSPLRLKVVLLNILENAVLNEGLRLVALAPCMSRL
jgi:C4-dicarboxylate-specific signal transduction histidine kinase